MDIGATYESGSLHIRILSRNHSNDTEIDVYSGQCLALDTKLSKSTRHVHISIFNLLLQISKLEAILTIKG